MSFVSKTRNVKSDFEGISAWRWSRRNLARMPEPQYRRLLESLESLKCEFCITRIIAPADLLRRIDLKKIDLEQVSETDIRSCVKPRTLFDGNVLDLRALQRVKRSSLKVLADVASAWLLLKFPGLSKQKYHYAFMVHPRDYADIFRGFPALKYLPKNWIRWIAKNLPPFVLSEITGLTDVEGQPMKGALMTVGWDKDMFDADVRGREEKVADLVILAKRLGIKFVGFAALLPGASRYGKCLEGTVAKSEVLEILKDSGVSWEEAKDLFTNPEDEALVPRPVVEIRSKIEKKIEDKTKRKQLMDILRWALKVGNELQGITITTGHPFTVAIVSSYVKELLRSHPKKDPLITVVGAGGSTGACCCRRLAEDGINNLMLVDRVKRTAVTSLEELPDELRELNPNIRVTASTNLEDLIQADIILVVTSAKGTIIDSAHLKPGAIVIDDSQPRNVNPKIAEERDDVLIINIMALMKGIIPNFVFDRHTPFTDASFSCLGDVILRARTHTHISATGPANMEGVRTVEQMVERIKNQAGVDPLAVTFYTYNRRVILPQEVRAIAALSCQSKK